MVDAKRCTVHKPGLKDGKVLMIKAEFTLDDFMGICERKLNCVVRRIFRKNGVEVQSLSEIRDEDLLWVTDGQDFHSAEGENQAGLRRNYRIAVLGPGGVGKSALSIRYVRRTFQDHYDPTIEEAYVKVATVDGEVFDLDILDTAGQDEFSALRGQWVTDRKGFVLVYSMVDSSTLNNLKQYAELINRHYDDEPPPVIVVANKSDLSSQRKVTPQQGEAFAKGLYKAQYVEASAKNGNNVEQVFTKLVRMIYKTEKEPGAFQVSTGRQSVGTKREARMEQKSKCMQCCMIM